MSVETERKFLLANDGWKAFAVKRTLFRQGYIPCADPARTVRVRLAGERAFLTLKAPHGDSFSRLEFEYGIPVADAEKMLEKMCAHPLVEKYRSLVPAGAFTWEIDEFTGENAGLVLAEIELPSENAAFQRPGWLGREVTGDLRYYNSYLGREPFSRWKNS